MCQKRYSVNSMEQFRYLLWIEQVKLRILWKNGWGLRVLSCSKNFLKVGHQAKLIYLPMLLCIFGQIGVLSRYSTKLTTIWVTGVVLTADYENWLESLKKIESRGLNEEFSIFEPGDQLWGSFLNSLEFSEPNHFFTGYIVWPALFIQNI